jgi:hypothetical protein
MAAHSLPHALRHLATWVGLMLALNLVWEVVQLPLYAFPTGTTGVDIAYAVAHCTLGDGVIASVSFLIAAVATRATDWPIPRPKTGLLFALASGAVWTIWAEWHSLNVTRAWAYAPAMPTIAGIGLGPLLQWVIIPTVVVLLMRTPFVSSHILDDDRLGASRGRSWSR